MSGEKVIVVAVSPPQQGEPPSLPTKAAPRPLQTTFPFTRSDSNRRVSPENSDHPPRSSCRILWGRAVVPLCGLNPPAQRGVLDQVTQCRRHKELSIKAVSSKSVQIRVRSFASAVPAGPPPDPTVSPRLEPGSPVWSVFFHSVFSVVF